MPATVVTLDLDSPSAASFPSAAPFSSAAFSSFSGAATLPLVWAAGRASALSLLATGVALVATP